MPVVLTHTHHHLVIQLLPDDVRNLASGQRFDDFARDFAAELQAFTIRNSTSTLPPRPFLAKKFVWLLGVRHIECDTPRIGDKWSQWESSRLAEQRSSSNEHDMGAAKVPSAPDR